MDCKRPAIAAVLVMLLSGCLWAPGQHMRTSGLAAGGTQARQDRLTLISITPRLVAMDLAERQASALPATIASYRPGPYRFGPGDVLYITVWDHPELTVPAGPQQQLNAAGRLVQSDGTLFYPYIGEVIASGKTPIELRREITARLAHYIEAPQVDVAILSYGSQRVWVTGATRQPTFLALTVTPMTLADAVSQAGLDATQADLSGIRLTRDGMTYSFDLDQPGRDSSADGPIFLRDGDHLHVPYLDHKEVFVVGEVNQPGALSFRTKSISLSQALGRARGLLQSTADGNAIYVIRGSRDLRHVPSQVFQLEAKSPSALAVASQFDLHPGDTVFVGAAGVTRWSRFVNQLLPFTNIISNAASARSDLGNN